MSESRPKKRKIEFIESYWTGGELGSDYQWNDNHGELIRCKDCQLASMFETEDGQMFCECRAATDFHKPDWFCADGIAKDTDAHNK